MFTKAFVSTVAAAMTLSSIAPAFAYIVPGATSTRFVAQQQDTAAPDRPTRRAIRSDRDREVLQEIDDNPRDVTKARVLSSGTTKLNRARLDRLFRRFSRSPKGGYDRYRILHRPNTRYFREKQMEAEEQASLPSFLVVTGGNSVTGRPTRRSIRGDRDRDVLQEMEQCSVRGAC